MSDERRDFIKTWLPVFLVAGSLVAQWAIYGYRLDAMENHQRVLMGHKNDHEIHQPESVKRALIRNELHPLEVDIELLKDDIGEIRDDVREIKEALRP